MARGEALHVRQQPPCERALIGSRPYQQPRTRSGSERHGGGELGVVAPPITRVGLRPREVEDELPVRVGLDECGGGGGQPGFILEREVAGLPAGSPADAAGVLQRGQELVTQEWIA